MTNIGGTLVTYFQKGGFVMYPLLLLSILGLVVVLERGFTLYYRSVTRQQEDLKKPVIMLVVGLVVGLGWLLAWFRFAPALSSGALRVIALLPVVVVPGAVVYLFRPPNRTAELVTQVRRHLEKGDVDGAIGVCEEHRGPTAAMLKAALLRWDVGREEMDKLLENAALHEIAWLERGLWLLALISNIAPILGFLGTVVGMIMSFEVISRQGLQNPGLVAQGISVALITTAAGLIVAVMNLPFYNLYSSRVAHAIREMETTANIIVELHEQLQERAAVQARSTA